MYRFTGFIGFVVSRVLWFQRFRGFIVSCFHRFRDIEVSWFHKVSWFLIVIFKKIKTFFNVKDISRCYEPVNSKTAQSTSLGKPWGT